MLCAAVNQPSDQLIRLDTNLPTQESGRTLFGLNAAELAECMTNLGEPGWRGSQLAEALYRQRVTEIEAISTLPKALRARLKEKGWQVGRPRLDQVFI